MVDIGPIMVDIIPLIMVVMAVIILQQCTFNDRTVRKQQQDHRPTIGTTAAIQKAIIHMSKSAQTAGCRLPLNQLHNKEGQPKYMWTICSIGGVLANCARKHW